MLRNLLVFLSAFSLACLILIISIFRIAQIKYVFSSNLPTPSPSPTTSMEQVDYNLPYPGTILSDSVLWPLKAARDRIWLALTINPSKKADLYLLLADKRLADAQVMFERNKFDLGISVLTKSEKYLESAQLEERVAHKEGMSTTDFLTRFSVASVKHRQVLDELLTTAPEDARPMIVKLEDYSKSLYNQARNGLLEAGANVPLNPYEKN